MTGLEIVLLVLAILGLAVAATATVIILTLPRNDWHLCFPPNSWPVQVMFCAGTVLIFAFNVICRFTGWPAQAMQHLPFAACFAALLVNEFNAMLLHQAPERRLVLGSETLATMAAFCTVVGPIVTLTAYSVFFKVSHYAWHCLTALNGTVNAEPLTTVPCAQNPGDVVELFNSVTAYAYSYAYYLLCCATVMAFFATMHKTVYSNYMTMTVVSSWTLWTTNWCLRSIAPPEGLILTNGFVFLVLYLVPQVAVYCYAKSQGRAGQEEDECNDKDKRLPGAGSSPPPSPCLPDVTVDCGTWCVRWGLGRGDDDDVAQLVESTGSGGGT
ncbi:G protein-coupled receptor-6.2 [Proboscivirus elephantidbeta4]|uniref:G protein-coupled receptor-6.2 n=1 Tax=Elephant endotheliotropic herpesvirus 4 TaxID=548914 RepID=A0A0S1TPE3_9BETA|nr:G protein-coupled receptor-6.2 [Elephant endotheliotropic herpesvirus 4]ALM25927.1 G protein-coupled receptor-6.2 [Elephant endotheliotropic herpesvirus 4]